MASDISVYNFNNYTYKIENVKEYEYPFERLKAVEEQYKDDGKDKEGETKEEKLEEIKEDQE